MRHRGPISEVLTNSFLAKQQRSKNNGVIGFAPARIIDHFSFMNPKHALITIGITITVLCSTSFIHWLLNDFEKMEATQQREVKQIEDLFEEEYKWMQNNHEFTLKALKEAHQKDLDTELKWFIEEINSITLQKAELNKQHEEAQQQLKATTSSHEYHSAEQKKLDDELNQLYTDAADKIDHLNKVLNGCNNDNKELDQKLWEAQQSQINQVNNDASSVPPATPQSVKVPNNNAQATRSQTETHHPNIVYDR